MSKLLENIFSVKNQGYHKTFTLMGVKFKFRNEKAIQKRILSGLNDVNMELNKTRDNVAKLSNTVVALNNKVVYINNEERKKWVIENIGNKDFYEQELLIYNTFEQMKARKFYPIFRDRISRGKMILSMKVFHERYPEYNGFIFTDVHGLENDFKLYNKDDIKNMNPDTDMAILAYNCDYAALDLIDEFNKYNIKYYAAIQSFPHARYFHTDENAFKVLDEEAVSDSWHFCPVDFENIFQALKASKTLEGDYVEIGTFKGDSASAALNYMKKANINKKAYFIDTYEGFNYKQAFKSNDTFWKEGHTNTSYDNVKERLSKYDNANVVKGNIISDDLPAEIEKICVANIDVDLYEAVKAALYKVKDKVVKNGIIIAEDYGHTPTLIGGQKAVDEFIEENVNDFIPLYMNSGQMFLIKK